MSTDKTKLTQWRVSNLNSANIFFKSFKALLWSSRYCRVVFSFAQRLCDLYPAGDAYPGMDTYFFDLGAQTAINMILTLWEQAFSLKI